jgi:hypothetical protein
LTGPETVGHDWAANTGATRNSGRGVQTRDIADRSSSLRPAGGEGTSSEGPPKMPPKSNRNASTGSKKRKA